MYTFFDSVNLSCAKVLTYVGDNGITVGNRSHLKYSVKLIGGSKTGDEEKTVTIDDKLYGETSDGNDDILKKDWCTKSEKLSVKAGYCFKIFFRSMYNIDFANNHKTIQCGKSLSGNGCKRSSGNTPVKHGNKSKIQNNVDQSCNDHGNQRCAAVSESSQHRRKNVISRNYRNSAENNPQIDQRHSDDIIRCI